MPPVKSIVSIYCILLAASISLNGKIIDSCSYCARKGLVYIIIIALFGHQSSSYTKCIKSNTCSSCDICLVFINKYIFPVFVFLFVLPRSLGVNTL